MMHSQRRLLLENTGIAVLTGTLVSLFPWWSILPVSGVVLFIRKRRFVSMSIAVFGGTALALAIRDYTSGGAGSRVLVQLAQLDKIDAFDSVPKLLFDIAGPVFTILATALVFTIVVVLMAAALESTQKIIWEVRGGESQ